MRTVKKGKAKVKERKKEKDKHPVHVEDWDQNRHRLLLFAHLAKLHRPNIGPMSRDGVQLRSRLGV